jgi:hypothetical protein
MQRSQVGTLRILITYPDFLDLPCMYIYVLPTLIIYTYLVYLAPTLIFLYLSCTCCTRPDFNTYPDRRMATSVFPQQMLPTQYLG